MKKVNLKNTRVIIYLIMIVIFLIGCSKSNNVIPDNDKESNEVLRTITGVVTDATMNTITIKDNSDNIYSFEKNSDVLEVNENGITIGMTATIEYYGELTNTDKIQTVKVVKIKITEKSDLDKANEILSSMTLEEKVGQMFYVRCPEESAVDMVQQYKLGGYILFQRDFDGKSKVDVISNIQSYQDASKINMLIGVDEEGGTVNRVSSFSEFRNSPFLSPKEIYNQGGFDLMKSDTEEKAKLLKSLGVNVNMAPVCDVVSNANSFMYDRSFSPDADSATEYVKSVVEVMNENEIGSVLKHFPGYGDNEDTHTGIAYDNREYSHFENIDFKPFIGGIEAGAGCVLVSHNIVYSMDSQYPASLSKPVHDILRNELGFNGVIITDDLYMDAIKQYTNDNEAAVLAVKAGNDLICTTDFQVQIPAVIEAVNNGEISESKINESVLRILLWKLELGIIK